MMYLYGFTRMCFHVTIMFLALYYKTDARTMPKTEMSMDNTTLKKPGAEDLYTYSRVGFSIPDYTGDFEIEDVVYMSYDLYDNKVVDLELEKVKFRMADGVVHIKSHNASGHITGKMDIELEVDLGFFDVDLEIEGSYYLSIDEADNNVTIGLAGLQTYQFDMQACSIVSKSITLQFNITDRPTVTSAINNLIDWISRAIREHLENLICVALESELHKGLDSEIIKTMISNIRSAGQLGGLLTATGIKHDWKANNIISDP